MELRAAGVASSSLGSAVDVSGLLDDDDDDFATEETLAVGVEERGLKLGYVNVLEFVSDVTMQISSYG